MLKPIMETVEVVRVKFLWPGKIYEFSNPEGFALKRKDRVVVQTGDGSTLVGSVSIAPRIRLKRKDDANLPQIIRIASDQDIVFDKVADEYRSEVKQFFETRVRARQMSGIRLIDIEKMDGGRKLVVYFASENNKFPIKDVAMELGHRFNVRIDLRPVGIRDAARMAGGIGKCGLSLCCATWLPDFEQVSIRMAKDQGLSLEPEGISGQCGRLLCCLGYEHQNYLEMGQGLPKVGKVVVTPVGDGRVVKLDILKSLVTVRTEDGVYETFHNDEVKRKFGPGGGGPRSGSQDDSDDQDDEEVQDPRLAKLNDSGRDDRSR
jgi:cell fate regulator YaaT (PSP1 superfamily)